MNELIAIRQSAIGEVQVNTVNARDLHAFLEAKKDFSTWIKDRIEKYGFTEGVDFVTISRSPVLGSGNRGAAIDYHLSIDMAKELSMVERNEKGKQARIYFIECEKVANQPQNKFNIPSTLPEALRLAADLAEQNNKLSEKITADRPRVEFAAAIEDSKKSIKVGDFAKLLNNAGLKIGRNRMFEWLREKKYLMPNNEPYQTYIDNRWFSVIEKTRESDNGPVPYIQTMITGKGQISITKKIIEYFNPIITFGEESRA